jgi:pimeloyl-ACP methyl ester carboxylesterase
MSIPHLRELKNTAAILGSCDPIWLKTEQEPEMRVLEGGKTGPEVILLHGLLGALSNWDSLFPLMEAYCKPMALHFPILTAHRSEVKVKALSVFTEYLIRKKNIAPAVLCGNSLGGHVAMRLCLAAPELVDCLILSGASGLYEHSVDTLPIRPNKEFVREHMARVFYNPRFITDQAVEDVYQSINKRRQVLNLIHAARSAKKDNLLSVLKDIKVPTLLLWGEDDQVTTMDVAETFAKNIPNSKLVTIKNCGHAPMIEYPEWFSGEVEKFLKENSRYYRNK